MDWDCSTVQGNCELNLTNQRLCKTWNLWQLWVWPQCKNEKRLNRWMFCLSDSSCCWSDSSWAGKLRLAQWVGPLSDWAKAAVDQRRSDRSEKFYRYFSCRTSVVQQPKNLREKLQLIQSFSILKCVLGVQNSSIGDIVPLLVRPSGTTNNQSLHNTTEWT